MAGEFLRESPARHPCQGRNGAIHLFEDGQARIRDGRYGPATVTFRAVAQVYPESPLAKQAEAASRVAERKEERTGAPVVRSIAFQHMAPATTRQILDRFGEREVGLGVEQTYRQEDLEHARRAIAGLLAEKGVRNLDVRAEIHPLSNNRVENRIHGREPVGGRRVRLSLMKAVRIHRHGGPEVLVYEDVPEPRIRADQVLVRVRACALNHLDLFVRAGIPRHAVSACRTCWAATSRAKLWKWESCASG